VGGSGVGAGDVQEEIRMLLLQEVFLVLLVEFVCLRGA
jgi:hypothetical protein